METENNIETTKTTVKKAICSEEKDIAGNEESDNVVTEERNYWKLNQDLCNDESSIKSKVLSNNNGTIMVPNDEKMETNLSNDNATLLNDKDIHGIDTLKMSLDNKKATVTDTNQDEIVKSSKTMTTAATVDVNKTAALTVDTTVHIDGNHDVNMADAINEDNSTVTKDISENISTTGDVIKKNTVPTEEKMLINDVVLSDEESNDLVCDKHLPVVSKRSQNVKTMQNTNKQWTVESKLDSFLKWCEINSLILSPKVAVKCKGTSHRYGLMAEADIKKGETLFTVPRRLLLHADNGALAEEWFRYEDWLQDIGKSLDDSSGWVPLLITIMYECNNKENSFWAPYLRLIPEEHEFGHPLFWTEETLQCELKGMSLCDDVERDTANIEEEYHEFVLPFLYQNKEIFKRIDDYGLNFYKHIVAFVMAYSFTELQELPGMIPMADILNHHSNNNAHLVFETDCLKMVSLKKIEKGEEIFNTFGKLGNAELLQMYGYVESPTNQFDTLVIPVTMIIEVVEKNRDISAMYIQAIIALLNKTEIALPDECFLFDKNGMRKGPDFIQLLRVLHMNEIEFEEMLKHRAGNRPDSFYQKLLRKVKLAKKTDVSSGVAVIDITEEENDSENIEKRKFVELQEIEDSDDVKRLCTNGDHDAMQLMHLMNIPLECGHSWNPYPSGDSSIGNTKSSAIVIDDESDDEENMDIDKLNSDSVDQNGSNKLVENYDKDTEKNHSDLINPNESSKCLEDSDRDDKTNSKQSVTYSEVLGSQIVTDVSTIKESDKNIIPHENVESGVIKKDANKSGNIRTDETGDKTKLDDPVKDKSEKIVASILDNSDDIESQNMSSNELVQTNTKEKCNGSHVDITYNELSEMSDSDTYNISSEILGSSDTSTSVDIGESNDIVSETNHLDTEMNLLSETTEIAKHTPTLELADSGEQGVNVTEEESDDEDIEFVSCDIRCEMAYEKLNQVLSDEWRDTIRRVLNLQLQSLKNDDDIVSHFPTAEESMPQYKFDAYQVRRGQRSIIRTFLASLK